MRDQTNGASDQKLDVAPGDPDRPLRRPIGATPRLSGPPACRPAVPQPKLFERRPVWLPRMDAVRTITLVFPDATPLGNSRDTLLDCLTT